MRKKGLHPPKPPVQFERDAYRCNQWSQRDNSATYNSTWLLTAYGGAGRIEEGRAFLKEAKKRWYSITPFSAEFNLKYNLPYKNPEDIERILTDAKKVFGE